MGAGVVLIGVGFLVALMGALMHLGIESNRDREREEEARRYFDRYGRWPGQGRRLSTHSSDARSDRRA